MPMQEILLQVPSPATAQVPIPSAAVSAAGIPPTAPTPAPTAHVPAPAPSGTPFAGAPPGSMPGLAQVPTPATIVSASKPAAAALPPGMLQPTALIQGTQSGHLDAPSAAPASTTAGPLALASAVSQILLSGAPALAPGPSPAGREPLIQLQPSNSPADAPLSSVQSQASTPSGSSFPVPAVAPTSAFLPVPSGQPGSLAPFLGLASIPSSLLSEFTAIPSPSMPPPAASQSAWSSIPSLPPQAFLQGGGGPETPMMPSTGPAAHSPVVILDSTPGVSAVHSAPWRSAAIPPIMLFPSAEALLPETLAPGMQPMMPAATEAESVMDSVATALGSASVIEPPLDALGLPALGDAVFLAQGPASSGPPAAPQGISPAAGQPLTPATGSSLALDSSLAKSMGGPASYLGPGITQAPTLAAYASEGQTTSASFASASMAQAPPPAASMPDEQSAPTQAPTAYKAASDRLLATPAEAPSLQSEVPAAPSLPAETPMPEEAAPAAGGLHALPQHCCIARQQQMHAQHQWML